MRHLKFRQSAAALLLLSGCATGNFFTAAPGSKANTEPAVSGGSRSSSFTSSWSGITQAGQNAQDTGGSAERRLQEVLTSGERSQASGDRRAARTAFEQALRLAPGDPYANYQLAKMDDDDGRFADAELHYFTLMRQTPNDPDILSSLGWSYYLQGRYDDSNRVLREALRYDPSHQTALYNLGWLYGTRGDYDGALAIFRSAGSEADAQKALALLRQNTGTPPVVTEQVANAPVRSAAPITGSMTGSGPSSTPDLRVGPASAEPEYATPQARKVVEDYKRLKAENDQRQQDKRARLAQKNFSAPSPWNSNRQSGTAGQRDSGQAIRVAGQMDSLPNDVAADNGRINGRFPAGNAAFPGAAPTQANRPRVADPAGSGFVGNATTSAGLAPVVSPGTQPIPGTQVLYEQPGSAVSRSPVITPKGESPMSRGNNSPSWNSLPPDDAYRGDSNGGSGSPPANRIGDWPRSGTGNLGSTSQSIRNNAPAGFSDQRLAAPPQRISTLDAQTTAAELGLSAGSSGLGFPASEWPASASGLTGTGGGPVPVGAQVPPSNLNLPAQTPQAGGPTQGIELASPALSGPSSKLPPWPNRPLSGGAVPQAVVPSAQGIVYGSTGDSGSPNLNVGSSTVPPVRQQ
jgi:Flp pilus assembly protein TadD